MDLYDFLILSIQTEYDVMTTLRETAHGQVLAVRHKKSKTPYIFRQYEGDCEVYQKLLPVSSPHLPQIMEVGQKEGRCAVLEEYVRGDTLSLLLKGQLLSERQAREITRQLCSALWILHSMGAVHRDIKPENVILRGGDAVLIDFDASRVFKLESGGDTRVLGTVGYAAPEQFGLSQTDSQADIYALGVLLNIMLTGKHPSMQLAGGRMGRIVQKCTRINPQKRYHTVGHLVEALGL